ncbi:MAG: flagellar basal body rod protein FlgC [Vulcanimicrobiaceae bacterium]
MSEFDILRSAAAGMDAQRSALDLAARNVAAAEATDGGHPFERLVPRFAVARAPVGDADGIGSDVPDEPQSRLGESGHDDDLPIRYLGARAQTGVEVDTVTEMVAVLDAQRAYESNASVFDLGKRLAERTIDVGRLA